MKNYQIILNQIKAFFYGLTYTLSHDYTQAFYVNYAQHEVLRFKTKLLKFTLIYIQYVEKEVNVTTIKNNFIIYFILVF